MKKITNITILIALSLLAYSCATPDPTIRLKPKDESTRWNNGQEFAIYADEEVKVAGAYYRNTEDYLIFNLMIENLSAATFLVDPAQMKINYFFYDSTQSSRSAVDPESKLLEIDRTQNQLVADNKNDQTASIIMGTAVVATAVAVAVSDENDEDDDDIAEYLIASDAINDISIERQISEENFNFNMNDLDNARLNWENNTVRKTHLDAGFFIDGQVFFPRNDLANEIQIEIPLGNKTVRFKFNQKVYRN